MPGQRLTASRLALAKACLWSFTPDAELAADLPSVYRDEGNELATWQARLINPGDAPLDLPHGVLELPPRVARWWQAWQEIRPATASAEVALAYDPRRGSARVLGTSIGRRYTEHGAEPHEVCMSADVAGLDDEFAVVTDTKGGPGERYLGRVPHAGENPQLRCNVMAWALATGRSKARVELHHVDAEGAIAERQIATFDAIELGAIQAEVDELADKLARGRIKPKAGTHCVDLYCPALPTCEAAQREAAALIPVDRLTQAIAVDPGRAVVQYELASKLMARWQTELKAYVDEHGPIVIDDVWQWSKRVVSVKPETKIRAGYVKTEYRRTKRSVA